MSNNRTLESVKEAEQAALSFVQKLFSQLRAEICNLDRSCHNRECHCGHSQHDGEFCGSCGEPVT